MLFLRINTFILTLLVVEHLCVLELVMERCELDFVNATYFKELKFTVRKYSRGGKRYLNAFGIILKTLRKNMMVTVTLEEYLHNEYRPTFIYFDFKWCDLIESPFMRLKEKYGLPCPTTPMEYNVPNITIYTELLPEAFPIRQGRIRIRAYETNPPIGIASGYLYASFIKKVKH
ncbi:uncharacterized protein LOC123689408 [Pieris rapae]|uniref:uncharacterized protein LOC123689408 n=1 Tax=Pieris rapae TaxID=64459 RepID=UPI001E27DE53|nr:uncharacterized protein LOC123689408 [Pieris rapae]